ncbi:MAG: phosphate ABC transporter permease subunit PstC [Melioribacteraceae bacterium]|nr:phosphate ABC transporter permease subunit PstC [Melioribacteraceae bacterium]
MNDKPLIHTSNKAELNRIKEKFIEIFFRLNGLFAAILILLIFFFLIREALNVFMLINPFEFISINLKSEAVYEWYPTSDPARYSIVPLLIGSFLTAVPATIISTFFGVVLGVYLSEIASTGVREFLKPIIEVFAGIPTVVVGFFMLVVAATLIQDTINPPSRLNAFLASLGLSIIVIPIIASLTDEALKSIPNDIRMAAYSLGASKWQTISKVIFPTALSGVSASVILGFGRAIGETMIVLMASGNAAIITVDIFSSVRTISATIAAEMGEVSVNSAHYFSLFFIGLILFAVTLLMNLLAELFLNKMKKRFHLY